MKNKIQNMLIALVIFAGIHHVFAQGTAFTYNGRLNDGTNPATGSYDLTFTLYNAATGGVAAGALTNAATGITNGLFTVPLDFGGVFNGANYWLELAARTNGADTFTTLSPRQQVLPTPYAIYAANAGNAGTANVAATAGIAGSVAAVNILGTLPLAQLPAAVVTNNETGANLTGTFAGNGGGLTNLPAASLTGTVADSRLSNNIARLNIPNTNVQATATAIVTAGFITGTTNLNGGLGYTNNPLVTVTDATGSNAVITATVANGVVTSLNVQNAGSQYSATATLTIAPPPSSAYQTFNCANVFNNAGNTFVGAFTGNGAGLTNLNMTGPSASAVLGNEANGYQALAANTTGNNNTANGVYALATNTNGSDNTADGADALQNNTTGSENSADGAFALQHNTSGSWNTADGYEALQYNTSGNNNVAIGRWSLLFNSTGNNNTGVGTYSLEQNGTGNNNTASGEWALENNRTGSQNTASGQAALSDNTSGSGNTANGYQSLLNNITGSYNTANGENSLESNTNGAENAANGGWALYSNTSGSYNTANGEDALHYNTTGSNNVANGFQSIFHNTTGNWNTANGVNALFSNTIGSFNTADGNSALNDNSSGNWNTASGFQSLYNNTTGSNNIALGSLAGGNITSGSSNIDIGNVGLASDANIIRIGSGQTQAFIAGVITGNGTGLTNLNPVNLSPGTAAINISGTAATAASVTGNIADAQLSANVALMNGTNAFTGTLTATNASNVVSGTFTGSGAGLVNIPSTAINGGINTNILIGDHTFYITNGIIMAIQ